MFKGYFDIKNKIIALEVREKGYYTIQELELLIEFEEQLKKIGCDFAIHDGDLFRLDDIISANAKMDSEIQYINSLTVPTENNRKLTDMEKFLMVYDFCSNFIYNENEEDSSRSRYITSILNGQNIVCVGYAKLLQEMCKRLGIECHIINSTVVRKKDEEFLGGHENNLVVLDGKVYYADACWDCQYQQDGGLKRYTHCLIPISDKEYFRRAEVRYSKLNVPLKNPEKDMQIARSFLNKLENGEEINEESYDAFNSYFGELIRKASLERVEFGSDYERLTKIRDLKFIIGYLKKYESGKAISYEEFEESLMNIYLAKGMNEKSAQNLLSRTMQFNEREAQKDFDKNATNCFVVGRTQELEI